jgi:hypothetical protein
MRDGIGRIVHLNLDFIIIVFLIQGLEMLRRTMILIMMVGLSNSLSGLNFVLFKDDVVLIN